MTENVAVLLPEQAVAQTKRLAAALRQGQVAPLVSAGLSVQSGVADWRDLVRRMVLAWKEWDPSTAAQALAGESYIDLVTGTCGSDLAVISYLRNRLAKHRGVGLPSFGEILFASLYGDPPRGDILTPQPLLTHRHLVALFQGHPRRIWTTNYDD